MMTLSSQLDNFYNRYWHLKFSIMHSQLNMKQCDVKKIRLVLGVGRSGTTWISKILSTTHTPIRYFEEPLYHIQPKLNFSLSSDHTAINYYDDLNDSHRLFTAYKLFTIPKYNWKKIGLNKFLKRDDAHFKYCIIKEVHSLLATKILLTKFKIKAIIVVRNPIYVTDSIFNAQTISSPYLINEARMIQRNLLFLKNHFPNNYNKIISTFNKLKDIKNNKERRIFETALTVAILINFLQNITQNFQNIYLVRYENLCLDPEKYFSKMAKFLSLNWNEENKKQLLKTTNSKNDNTKDPYSIFKNTSSQINRPLKFLNNNKIKEIKKLLQYCKLNY